MRPENPSTGAFEDSSVYVRGSQPRQLDEELDSSRHVAMRPESPSLDCVELRVIPQIRNQPTFYRRHWLNASADSGFLQSLNGGLVLISLLHSPPPLPTSSRSRTTRALRALSGGVIGSLCSTAHCSNAVYWPSLEGGVAIRLFGDTSDAKGALGVARGGFAVLDNAGGADCLGEPPTRFWTCRRLWRAATRTFAPTSQRSTS